MHRTAPDPLATRCPLCGARQAAAEARQCSCCGSPLRGMRAVAPSASAPSAPHPVRSHAQYEQWMEDAPTGLVHALGLGAFAAGGLVFALLALLGNFHSQGGGGAIALFVVLGLSFAAFGGWRLARFLQAPRKNRVALVASERERVVRTKHGWRTKHYATFELEDGSREEFPLSASLASELARGDCGVLITRDCFLLAFHRAGRA